MSNEQPVLPSRKGKRGTLVDPNGGRLHFTITDEIRKPQSDLPSKIIVLERILFDDGRIELRLGYYIIGKKPKMFGKWVWGQYCTLLPVRDFTAIVSQAQRLGWLSDTEQTPQPRAVGG